MAGKLAILATASGAYAFVWRHRRRFSSLAFPAIVVLAILTAIVAWFWPLAGVAGQDIGWGEIAVAVGGLVLWVMFAVAWHRRYLVPAESTTVGNAFQWRRRQTRFLLVTIGISLLVALGVSLSVLLGAALDATLAGGAGVKTSLYLVFPLVALYVYARLSLLFPAAAVDRRLGFAECFNLTRGNGWRLVAIWVLVVAPFWIALSIGLAATAILGTFGGLTGTLIGALFHQGLNFAGIAVGVSAISIAYRELVPASAADE
ncbi:MAG: hypothetical protein QGI13_10975 [Rhodospirillales bacterium]|jgi:hypothetical protein|nr:hypothetical protein [Rhodospirillales bacterium]